MEEIKSVRVRNILEGTVIFQGIDLSGSQFDIKVTIYRDGKKRSLIGFNSNGNKAWDKIEFRDRGRYSNYTDDELILEYIETNSKLKNSNFGIIQDPWLEKPPKERSFGFDPYYLNNGSIVFIDWKEGTFSVGGKKWSDNNGNELDIEKGATQSNKSSITKRLVVYAPKSYEGETKSMMLTWKIVEYEINGTNREYYGSMPDKDILNQLISYWKTQVPNYDKLELCNPDNERCELIDFISPVDPLEESLPEEDNKLVSEDPISDDKISLSFQIDSNISIRPREDFDFKLFIGEPPVLDGFDFGEEQDLSLLDEEFIEVEFQGGEEIFNDLKEAEEARQDGDNQNLETEQEPNNTPGAGTGVKSTGLYTSELPKESSKSGPNGNYPIKYGFNNVPYYGQWDKRWRDVVYGLWNGPANEKDFVELNMEDKSKWKQSPSNPNISTQWNNKKFNVKFDGQNGNNGFSSIFGGGCGITSFSMVINYWMIKLNKKIYTSPIKIAKLACDTGARSKNPPPNGTQPNSVFFKKIKEIFGLNVSTCKQDEAISLIKSGSPVIMSGTWKGFRGDGTIKEQTGGHFIVITGYEPSTKRFRVNDPGSTKSTYYFQDNLPNKSFWKITN